MSGLISIWARWGDYVLGVRDLRPGESLLVGNPAQPLVRLSADGTRVALLEGAEEPAPQEGEPCRFSRDGLDYTLVWVDVPRRDAQPRRRRVGMLSDIAVAAALAALSLLRPDSLRFEFLYDGVTTTAAGQSLWPEAVVEPSSLKLALDAALQNAPLVPSGEMRCGDGDMGDPLAPAPTRGRYALQGPRDNADTHLARPSVGTGRASSTRPLADLGPSLVSELGDTAPTAAFGRSESLGVDERDARGKMWGEELGDATGDNGLGLRHVASGAQKAVAVAPTDAGALRVVHTGLQVAGARKPSEVGRALAAHFANFAECAESVQAAPPSVVVAFSIDANGTVEPQPLGSDALAACLSREIRSVQFTPLPAGKSYVSYPLFFLRGGEGLLAPPQSKPEACDCGG